MKVTKYREITQLEYFFRCVEEATPDECQIWPYKFDTHGYGQLWHKDFKNHLRVHRAAKSYADKIDVPPSSIYCRHTCHTRACFNHYHLKWGTQAQNIADCMKDPANDRYRLSEEIIIGIAKDNRPNKVIALELGIDESTVSHIKIGRNWSHITGIKYVRKRLTGEQAIAIYHDRNGTLEQIAARHGTKAGTVHAIQCGRNFAHITGHKK